MNPYLAFAVLLATGLEGIDKGYRLPEPVEMNVYKMTPEELKENGIESLPESIGEAIAETERSTIVRQSLGDHVFDHLIELKKKEWDYYRTHLSQYDIDRSSDSVIYPLDGKQPLRSALPSFFDVVCVPYRARSTRTISS
ncbi:MAG: glutamine synthetase [Euryarchaeota archaeon]|jgi:glutamine synthetase|nr:glutamine synthetase [Euryarchaeota archaeon]